MISVNYFWTTYPKAQSDLKFCNVLIPNYSQLTANGKIPSIMSLNPTMKNCELILIRYGPNRCTTGSFLPDRLPANVLLCWQPSLISFAVLSNQKFLNNPELR